MGLWTSFTDAIGVTNHAATDAANAQKAALNQATNTVNERYNQLSPQYQPYINAGNQALSGLNNFQSYTPTSFSFDSSSLANDPGVAYRMEQANKALARRQAATGQFGGGRAQTELAKLNSDLGSQEYGNAFNRAWNQYLGTNQLNMAANNQNYNQLFGLANLGSNSLNSLANLGMNNANQVANNQLAAGNADAAKEMAWRNSQNGLFNGLLNSGVSLASSGLLGSLFGGSGSTPTSLLGGGKATTSNGMGGLMSI